jgi:hypothetical protein
MPIPFPWVFPYVEDPDTRPHRSGERPVLRPALELTLVGSSGERQTVLALVDSGSEHTLAAPFLARAIQAKPDPSRELIVGIGGGPRQVRFTDVLLRISPPGAGPDEFEEWQTEVGFFTEWLPPWGVILGQVGFFDHFTISMSRYSQALAMEPFDTFDQRFHVQIRESEDRRRRFKP